MARFVYVDEAGISSPAQEPYVIVVGVVVHIDQVLNGIEHHLQRLVERHIPPKNRKGFVFHAKEIFNGGGKVFKRQSPDFIGPPEWPLERRLKIGDDLAAIPKKFNLPIAIGIVERAKFPQASAPDPNMSAKDKIVAAHVTAYLQCAMFVEQWFRQNASNENCLMVVEDNEQARTLIRETQNSAQNPMIVGEISEAEQWHFPLRKIKEDPLFQPKKSTNVLQVADFCAYVFKRRMQGDEKMNRFYGPFKTKIIVFDDSWLKRRPGKLSRSVRRSQQH